MLRMLLALVAAAASLAATAADVPPLLSARVAEAIHARIAADEYPSVVVAVVDGDRSQVYGFGTLAHGEAPDADTVYQIGSITKTFTATLLAQAITQNQVQLRTPVATLLPGFTIPSRNGKAITLGELATQFSGLPRLPANMQRASLPDPYAQYDAAKLKAFLAGYQLTRDPGAGYEYSNLGFGLLGFALAQHAATSYAQLVHSRILLPLGMTATSAALREAPGARWAPGHDEQGRPAPPWHFEALAGAGAINSTGADMLRYLEACMRPANSPLGRAMRLARQTRRPLGGDESIGLAWMTRRTPAGDLVWHNGMTGGYASFMGFTADGKRGVVILTNVATSVDDLGFAALLANAPLAPAARQVALPVQRLREYVGQYQLAPDFVVTVMLQGDQLLAQATGQGAFPIFPSAQDRFFARIADIRIEFHRRGDGTVDSLVLHQDGRDSVAPRLDAAQAARIGGHHAIHLDATTLQQYVGRYQLTPDASFAITREGDQLFAQLTGQPAFPVYPDARDEFYYTVVDARLHFTRDSRGKVDALVLHQNGADHQATRLP